MKRRIGRELAVALLVAAGCSDGGSGTAGGQGGAPAGQTGATGGGGGAGSGSGGGGAAGTGIDGADAGTPDGGAADRGGDQRGMGGTGDAGSGGDAAAWLTPPALPPALVVPAGATVKVHDHAVGAQIYTCTAGGDGAGSATSYAWVLKAPDAKLYDANGVQVGTHGAGPNWTSSDGSVALGTKVIESLSPLPDAISWLLLRVSSTTGAGIFSDVTYVQRLSTTGGQAPASGCDATTIGMDTRVDYTAEYYLYVGGAGADWLAPPASLPDAIAIPTTVRLKLHDRGIGFQIYACLASGGADGGADGDGGTPTYAWVFKTPDALLYDPTFTPVGSHGTGPSWTSSDGSVITARLLAQIDSPLSDAIPWLLLEKSSTSGTGVFSDVSIVQRLNTAGGKAPVASCDATTVDTLTRVPYSADYYFYADSSGNGGNGGSDAGAPH